MSTKRDRGGLSKAIEEDPYDPTRREAFAKWLENHGEEIEALLQRRCAEILRDVPGRLTLFTRSSLFPSPGIDWDRLPSDKQDSLQSRIRLLLRERRGLQFVVVSELSAGECGFRPVENSPFMHWHVPNDHVQYVALPTMTEAEARALARRTEVSRPALPAPKGRRIGENARPLWDLG